MTRMEAQVGSNSRWVWAAGILLLLGSMAVLWHCAGTERPEIIKTTIRITKGKLGGTSLWNVTVQQEQVTSLRLQKGEPIPIDIWNRMNGTVVTFTEFGCDRKPGKVTEPLYTARSDRGEPKHVTILGEAGDKPDWGPVDCTEKGCFLPEYYFGPVEKDKRTCPEDGPELEWEMVLK